MNRSREVLAHASYSSVVWLYADLCQQFQRLASDVWASKRGVYSFILPPARSIQALPLSKDFSPAELAELARRVCTYQRQVHKPGLSIERQIKLHDHIARLYDRIGATMQAHTHIQHLQKLLIKINDLESLRDSYLQQLAKNLEWSDFKGIRQLKLIIKFRLNDLFVALNFRKQVRDRTPEFSSEWQPTKERPLRKNRIFDPLQREQIAGSKTFLKNTKSVLLGDPGSGKSTLLKYFAHNLALNKNPDSVFETQAELPLPIIISATAYSTVLRQDKCTIARYMENHDPALWAVFEEALKNGNALVMIDGLDEEVEPTMRVRVVRQIESFVNQYPGNRYIITSRIAGYSIAPLSSDFDHYVIEPFSENAIQTYLRNWYRNLYRDCDIEWEAEADALFKMITNQSQLLRLASNPLLLTIMVLIHYQGSRLTYRRVDLYWQIVDALAETWNLVRNISGRSIDLWLGSRRLDHTLVERILSPIAFKVHECNPGGLIPRDILLQQIALYFSNFEGKSGMESENLAADFLKLAQEQIGILTERGINQFAFTHLTLEEYLAARHLAGLENAVDEAANRLYNPRFEEVLLLASSMLLGEHCSNFINGIYRYTGDFDPWLRRSWQIAARALADEVNIGFQLKQQIIDSLLAFYLALDIDSFLGDEIRQVFSAFKGSTLEKHLLNKLIQAIRDSKHTKMKRAGIQALVAIGSPEPVVLEVLIGEFQNDDWLVRAGAAEALGELGLPDKAVVEALKLALSDPSREVRAFSAVALGELKQTAPDVLQALSSMLHDKESLVRANAAGVLGAVRANHTRGAGNAH
ncbi:HEAT repeat domain-containing protein [candidate division KSB1 bacterium]|nr:HEAT repeat domain-containing protein [candidate division KSB1 bacterium]